MFNNKLTSNIELSNTLVQTIVDSKENNHTMWKMIENSYEYLHSISFVPSK